MEQALELLQSVARNSDGKSLSEYLQFCSESKLFCFNNSKREANITLINSLLTSKDSYTDGLAVLDTFLDQCTKDLLSSNIFSWIQLTIKGLVNPEDSSLCSLSWKILGKLIQLSIDFPEARKNIALTVIPKVLDHFVREAKNGKEEFTTCLECLELTLRTYGKSCGFHKEAIGTLIFSHLETLPTSVFLAGRCFLHLAACGSPGPAGDNYASSWLKQEQFLLNSLHSQLDALYENINAVQDGYKTFQLDETYPSIPKITEKGIIKKKQRQAKQFQSLAVFLKIMLLGKFPARKKILPESILALVWRGLSINCQTLSKLQQSIDTSCLATVISLINSSSLEILDALVISCKMNLLPFSPLICRIFSQSLKWTETEEWPFGLTKPHSGLRVKIYECLCNWLSVSRACSGIEKYEDDLVQSILSDIHQDPPAVALKVPGGKRKKNKGSAPVENQPSIEFVINPEMSADVCEAALKTLSILMNSASSLLKPIHHRNLQETVVGKIISIQESALPPPYSNAKCRLAIYDALLALCQNPHYSFPPPINYAPLLFSNGIKDFTSAVSMHCLFALRSIEKILHPVCPTMDFPISELNLPRIDVSSRDAEEVNYLLNDSSSQKRKAKRKREQQLSSTPLNDNCKRPFIMDVDKSGEVNGNSTLVDSEVSANVNKGTAENSERIRRSSIDNNESLVSNIEAWNENELFKEKEVFIEENEGIPSTFSESVSADPLRDEPKPGYSGIQKQAVQSIDKESHNESGSPKTIDRKQPPCNGISLNDSNRTGINTTGDSQHQSKDSEKGSKLVDSIATESDDEMMSSFVDEVN